MFMSKLGMSSMNSIHFKRQSKTSTTYVVDMCRVMTGGRWSFDMHAKYVLLTILALADAVIKS